MRSSLRSIDEGSTFGGGTPSGALTIRSPRSIAHCKSRSERYILRFPVLGLPEGHLRGGTLDGIPGGQFSGGLVAPIGDQESHDVSLDLLAFLRLIAGEDPLLLVETV